MERKIIAALFVLLLLTAGLHDWPYWAQLAFALAAFVAVFLPHHAPRGWRSLEVGVVDRPVLGLVGG
ncbi:hypothetical protein SAMN04488539_2376 [Corynebacterium timonense]|uniref:Uncharacterized protein n=1 Tax=Corynebacterium timonense TaxID=441500 RepID=A0A1H1V100_9CORY|nr:hypothetical protein SAMN04488539_2376 [Corynebacterium timonense]